MSNPFNIAKEGSVASRFVSSSELSEAQKRREQSLKDAYARIGQSPPPSTGSGGVPGEEAYDPRSLFERLQAQKNSKQEKFDETWKLSNQFRGIDEGESEFLAEVQKERLREERSKREEEARELERFRRAALGRETSPPTPTSLLPKALSSSPPLSTPVSVPVPSAASSSMANSASPPSGSISASTKTISSTVGSAAKSKRKRDGGLLGIKRKTDVKKSKTDSEQGEATREK